MRHPSFSTEWRERCEFCASLTCGLRAGTGAVRDRSECRSNLRAAPRVQGLRTWHDPPSSHATRKRGPRQVTEQEALAFLNGIAAANLVRRYRIGKTALAAYSIATRLVQQQPQHADLVPHVETMKRLNRFGKKRPKPAQTTTAAPHETAPVAAKQE